MVFMGIAARARRMKFLPATRGFSWCNNVHGCSIALHWACLPVVKTNGGIVPWRDFIFAVFPPAGNRVARESSWVGFLHSLLRLEFHLITCYFNSLRFIFLLDNVSWLLHAFFGTRLPSGEIFRSKLSWEGTRYRKFRVIRGFVGVLWL